MTARLGEARAVSAGDHTIAVAISARPPPGLLASLSRVEAACFDRPWGETGLGEALAQSGAAVAYIASPAPLNEVIAYCLYHRVLDEVEILQLATQPTAQRRGLGQRIVAAVLDDAIHAGAVSVFLEVRRSNAAALAVYKQAGFAICGVRRGYYPPLPLPLATTADAEDALLLRCDLPLPPNSR